MLVLRRYNSLADLQPGPYAICSELGGKTAFNISALPDVLKTIDEGFLKTNN